MGTTEDTVREALIRSAMETVPESDDASLFDLGVIDSFGLMEVVGRLERAFGVKVPGSDLTPKRFETIAKMVAYFESRRG